MSYDNPTGLPSVTEILGPWINTRFFKEEHRVRGDHVHEAIVKRLKKLYHVPAEDARPYFDNFIKYVYPLIGKVVLSEHRLTSRSLGYTGQLDFVGFHSGDLTLLDWKSSKARQWWWPLQLAGYLTLLDVEMPDIVVKKVMSISLQKELDKRPLVRIYLDHEVEEFKKLFMSQLKIFKMGGKNHGKSNRIQGE